MKCTDADWKEFLHDPRVHLPWKTYVRNERFTHLYGPWAHVEGEVTCHGHQQMGYIVAHSPQVYNDGRFVVARID